MCASCADSANNLAIYAARVVRIMSYNFDNMSHEAIIKSCAVDADILARFSREARRWNRAGSDEIKWHDATRAAAQCDDLRLAAAMTADLTDPDWVELVAVYGGYALAKWCIKSVGDVVVEQFDKIIRQVVRYGDIEKVNLLLAHHTPKPEDIIKYADAAHSWGQRHMASYLWNLLV